MNAVEKIEQVLASGVLISDLLTIPDRGASTGEIQAEERAIGRRLSAGYSQFLARWNGANLDVLVLFGSRGTHPEIPCLSDRQMLLPGRLRSGVVIGSDPAGFVYVELLGEGILSVDTEGGREESVAPGFDDFICRYVFGVDANRFAGEDWKRELQAAGLVSPRSG